MRIATLSSYFTITAVFFILIAKILGCYNTNSVALLSSLIDSGLDILLSVLNMFVIRYSSMPPDEFHRWGHQKLQDLAIFTQANIFIISGVYLIYISVERIINPEEITDFIDGIGTMVFSTIVNALIVAVQTYAISKTKSQVLVVDRLHYISDFLMNLGIMASMAVSFFFNFYLLDSIVGLMIGFYIINGAKSLVKKSFKNLTDHELEDEKKETLYNILRGHDKIKGVHELKTRYAGSKAFIQFHLEMDGNMTLIEAHEISHKIIDEIKSAILDSEVTIHLDPEGVDYDEGYVVRL